MSDSQQRTAIFCAAISGGLIATSLLMVSAADALAGGGTLKPLWFGFMSLASGVGTVITAATAFVHGLDSIRKRW